jgi:hypothetical protein
MKSRMQRMDPAQQLREKRQQILDLAASYGAKNVRVFGSVASDIGTTKMLKKTIRDEVLKEAVRSKSCEGEGQRIILVEGHSQRHRQD